MIYQIWGLPKTFENLKPSVYLGLNYALTTSYCKRTLMFPKANFIVIPFNI